tara:strand:- start:1051 stop:1668 length:618 start_codon:yes stop_codon:yes gene_type:complete
MKLEVLRFNSSNDFTTGLLFDVTDNHRSFLCYTLEDEARTVKQWGETRIPAGKYKLTLRNEGGFHTRYLAKFGAEFHKGMIYVNEVPNFEYILWHIGNDDDDTAGCLLVGKTSQDNFIGNSTTAYKEIYPPIRDAILSGEEVTVTYIDYDGTIVSNKAKDHVVNISQVSKNQEDIMDILSTEIKHLKAEVKALRQAIILKGMQVK